MTGVTETTNATNAQLLQRIETYLDAVPRNAAEAEAAGKFTLFRPLGPWKYGGRVLDALPSLSGQDAATNHSGVAEFAGQWYIVYHLSNGPKGGGTYKREVAVDKLNFAADGTIQKVTPTAGLSF